MTTCLYIKASPRGARSRTIAVADRYLQALRAAQPGLKVETIELWQAGLPEFDGDRVEAKFTVFHGDTPEGVQKTVWDEVAAISTRFATADRYLFAVPMWNGGIPYKLKQYIDIVHQPGITFGFDPARGYFGLLKNKRATVVYTSGVYSSAVPSPAYGTDHQSTYLSAWLTEAGVTDIEEIRFQPTILTRDPEGDFARALEMAGERGKRG